VRGPGARPSRRAAETTPARPPPATASGPNSLTPGAFWL